MKSLISLSPVLLLSLALTLTLTLNACGKSSSSDDNTPAVSADSGSAVPPASAPIIPVVDGVTVVDPVAGGNVPATEAPAVLVSLQVDATDKVNFVYLDLDSGKIVAEADASWDLAFKRTVIKQNSNVTTAISTDSTFDAILTAPAEATLAADAPVAGGLETAGLVFHEGLSWYTYDINVHVIYSNNFVYFVKSNSGAEYKLSIKDYYDADRLPAFIQVQYIKVAAAQSTAAVTE